MQHAQPDGAAVLTTALFNELPAPRTIEIAHVLDIWTDYNTVLHRAEAFEACAEAQRQDLRPCVVRAGRHVFPRERPIRMIDGLGVVVDVPMIINAEAWNIYVRPRMENWPEFAPDPQPQHDDVDDHATFMAHRPVVRRPSSSSSSRSYTDIDISSASDAPSTRSAVLRRTVVFTLDGTSFSCHLPDEHGHERLHSIDAALSLPPGDVLLAVDVSARPDDLVAMDLMCVLIVKVPQQRPIPFLRLALLDLESIEPNDVLPGVFQRSAKWLPHTTTRLSLFRILRLEDLLTLHEDKTHLWINNILVDPLSVDALTIDHGDYVKIFIGSDEHQFHCDVGSDAVTLMQITDKRATLAVPLYAPFDDAKDHCPNDCNICASPFHDFAHRDVESAQPIATSFSFTEEFLRAVDALRTATDAMPEFLEDDPGDITAYEPWVQHLHEAWTRFATIGPGGMERLGRIETWFTDHTNFQRCHHTRIAVLGPDAHRWEEQLRHLWRQYVIPGAPLEFHLVEPTPEDATGQVIGQLILVQRPHFLQRSVVVSTFDSDYDQGRAHSIALVMGDHIDLHSVRTMLQAHDDCPPEMPLNVCTLSIGTRVFEPNERIPARHGSAFKFVIQRTVSTNVMQVSGTDLQARMDAIDARMRASQQQRLLDTMPLWLQSLHRVFQDLAETERLDEGPVAYVATWYLHASYAPRCEPGRIVRLRDDPTNWQRTLLEAWGDRRDSSRIAELFWISPAPPTSLTDHVLGHILIVQALPTHSVAALLTARVRDHEGQALSAFF